MDNIPGSANSTTIQLDDQQQYFYTSRPCEITNVLGMAVATLTEYVFTGKMQESYKLHKTKEAFF